MLDDLSLAIGAERSVDVITGQAGCVVGNSDLLIGERAAHNYPGGYPTGDQQHTKHDGGYPGGPPHFSPFLVVIAPNPTHTREGCGPTKVPIAWAIGWAKIGTRVRPRLPRRLGHRRWGAEAGPVRVGR